MSFIDKNGDLGLKCPRCDFENPLSASEISKVISSRSNGKIFKVPATLQDSIEKRLNREGYVVRSSTTGTTTYSITSKGNRLLQAWIAFLDGCS
jgi:DNA-binding PadR family transcriptional regulator